MENVALKLLVLVAKAVRRVNVFRRREDGNATVEFVLVFPLFMILFMSSFQLGLLMTRNVMLERGVDMAVRAVRIGTIKTVTNTQMKRMICNGAGIIPDCMNNLRLEMRSVDLRNWSNIPVTPDCTDLGNPGKPLVSFVTGGANTMMVVRACALYNPMFIAVGLGLATPKVSGQNYALVATSAFVMEPP